MLYYKLHYITLYVIYYMCIVIRQPLTEMNKISPITGPRCAERSRKLSFPNYVTMAHVGDKVVSLTHWPLLTPGNTHGTHFC